MGAVGYKIAGGRPAGDITSVKMQKAIEEWFELYFQRAITKEEDPCQRLPYAIVNKLSKTVFSEYSASIVDGDNSPKSRWQKVNLAALTKIRKEALQWCLIGGECLLKPVLGFSQSKFTVIRRNSYTPLGRDPTGMLTSVVITEKCSLSGKYYTLHEVRTVIAGGHLNIRNILYQSSDREKIGIRVPLSMLPQYTGLLDEWTSALPLHSTGLVQLRTPMVNCVDGSNEAVSVYEPAVQLIRNINRNERQYDSEFDNGRNRIIASSDLVQKDAFGNASVPSDLFIGLDDDQSNVGFTIYNPTLRDENYERRRQGYLRSCETLIGFKRGILSEVEAVERTAAEITSSAGEYSLTTIDFQNSWYDAVQDALQLCNTLGQILGFVGPAEWSRDQLAMDWGNGILYDDKAWWSEVLSMVESGMLKAEIAIAWKYDLPWEKPEDLQLIREKYMPDIEQLRRFSGGF